MAKYDKGAVIHRTRASAEKIGAHAKAIGIKYKIVKVKGGYRVDKDWSI